MFFVFFYFLLGFWFLHLVSGGSVLWEFFLFSFGGAEVSFSFLVDYISLGFFSSISLISGLVYGYSEFYMEGTVDSRRFLWLVFGFVFSMFLLVFSGNFFLALVGWDGLGLISFCLVIFYSNHSSLESGLITVFSNRVGDVFFLVCFFYFLVGGSFLLSSGVLSGSSVFFGLLFLGAITKSAQLPFSAWLPAAMAAPTPVSSLVHSSTLVTAGVYLLVRFFYLFEVGSLIYSKIFFFGTMLVAGVCANLEKDFKKVVAMSTLSQLGLMLFVLSVGVWLLAFLHMIIHAFFKSMLFLSTGSLMSHLGGNQDSRFFGGNQMSFFSFLYFWVSGVCLMGFPFYIGFYSKDLIILGSSFSLGLGYYFVFLGGCLLTILYSIRLMKMSYGGMSSFYSFFTMKESVLFFFNVLFLFLKCVFLGGVFYFCFLFDGLVFFEGIDVFVGLGLLLLGILFKNMMSVLYGVSVFYFGIAFMRWLASGGSSFLFLKWMWHRWDFGWLEFVGGQGVFSGLSYFSLSWSFFSKVGLGVLFAVSGAVLFIFCF